MCTIKLMFLKWTMLFTLLEIIKNHLYKWILVVSGNLSRMPLFRDVIRNGKSTLFTVTYVMNVYIAYPLIKISARNIIVCIILIIIH